YLRPRGTRPRPRMDRCGGRSCSSTARRRARCSATCSTGKEDSRGANTEPGWQYAENCIAREFPEQLAPAGSRGQCRPDLPGSRSARKRRKLHWPAIEDWQVADLFALTLSRGAGSAPAESPLHSEDGCNLPLSSSYGDSWMSARPEILHQTKPARGSDKET